MYVLHMYSPRPVSLFPWVSSIFIHRDGCYFGSAAQSRAPTNSFSMTPIPLRFDSKDMLNSALVRQDGTIEFTTNTQLDFYGHKRTTLESRSGARATIDWASKTFIIGGKERLWTQLKKAVGNPLSSKFRIWNWSETRYTVRYARDHDGEMRYSVRRSHDGLKWEKGPDAADTDVARLSPIVVHFFQPPEHAVLSIAPELEGDRDALPAVGIACLRDQALRCQYRMSPSHELQCMSSYFWSPRFPIALVAEHFRLICISIHYNQLRHVCE
ncbi:hypothetical protein MVEN_01608300 [Mycena venus]|uniref:Uncharacterized protein n=1 Tax=Mycena venus TaxID=2733690 RepID=A0A8H7CPY1_9AGAR|nr:hypothetical protein MVEN_01608300 [Mycena venus]